MAGPEATLDPRDDGWVVVDAEGKERGWVGPVAADRPAWGAPLFGFEMDLVVGAPHHVQYAEVPTTPSIERDIALVLPDSVSAAQIEASVRKTAGALLDSLYIFDEYRGDAVKGRSVAWRLIFRSPGRTLRDKDADGAVERVLAGLKEQFNVERR
jgi:phenylalanyl-tRNA synthetase beta chain